MWGCGEEPNPLSPVPVLVCLVLYISSFSGRETGGRVSGRETGRGKKEGKGRQRGRRRGREKGSVCLPASTCLHQNHLPPTMG